MCRDNGPREDRQKTRLMWLVEALGVDNFRKGVAQQMGLDDLPPAVHVKYEDTWARRDVVGIHPQKQVGLVQIHFQALNLNGGHSSASVSFSELSRCCTLSATSEQSCFSLYAPRPSQSWTQN